MAVRADWLIAVCRRELSDTLILVAFHEEKPAATDSRYPVVDLLQIFFQVNVFPLLWVS